MNIVYLNGEFLPFNEAHLSIRDQGFVYGHCVFDTARTFQGRLFRLEEHIERLFNSLAYAQIKVSLSPEELAAATEEVVARNLSLLEKHGDFWVSQRISSGEQYIDGVSDGPSAPSVVIDCIPLPLKARARFFKEGIKVNISDRVRTPPESVSPLAKTNNYLNVLLAQKETELKKPGAWSLMKDIKGNIAEGIGCNFFMVKDGVVKTPTADYVLGGVTRNVVMEICKNQNLPLLECDISVEDVMQCDEAFLLRVAERDAQNVGIVLGDPLEDRFVDVGGIVDRRACVGCD